MVAGLGGRGRDRVRELKGVEAFRLVGCADIDGEALAPLLTDGAPRHPLGLDRLDAAAADDYESLAKVAAGCLEGVRMRGVLAERLIRGTRPRLAVVAFTEVHHASHYLWHTHAPGDPVYGGGRPRGVNRRSFLSVDGRTSRSRRSRRRGFVH